MVSLHHLLMAYLLVSLTIAIEGIHTQPEYKVVNSLKQSKGGRRFETEITKKFVLEHMASASRLIWKTFGQVYPKNTKDVKEITVFIGNSIYDFVQIGNNIHVDVMYIQTYRGNDLKLDFTRRLYHAMAKIWQCAEEDDGPVSYLKESIAKLIELKADIEQTADWVPGRGKRWDENSVVTAIFLDYCNSLRSDFIAKLDQKLKDGFKKEYFLELLGIPLDVLWKEYKYEHYS